MERAGLGAAIEADLSRPAVSLVDPSRPDPSTPDLGQIPVAALFAELNRRLAAGPQVAVSGTLSGHNPLR
jgi:hypothetical protein